MLDRPPPGYGPPQMTQMMPPGPPMYGPPGRQKLENFGIIFIVVGTILIGVGIMLAGHSPADITIGTGSGSGGDYQPNIKMDTLQAAAILAGIGTILEGLGAALNVKAHFVFEEYKMRR